ncbi:unnamed protein product [Blepharisma stoltei]|uniref:LOV domain-containing protein n=1 Tax=Blepharisma stoltei TaxID=1481888 RepID=A0AAU9ILP8_9CILI|nr:unnamed protein product [Blepharisma stoltei]
MGACCGKQTMIIVNFKGQTAQITNITSLEMIIQKCKTMFKEAGKGSYFLFLNTKKLTSDNELVQACRSSSKVTLNFVKEEVLTITSSDPLFSLSQNVCRIIRGDIYFSSILLTPEYVLVSKIVCPDKSVIPSLQVVIPGIKNPQKFNEKIYAAIVDEAVILKLELEANDAEALRKRSRIRLNEDDIGKNEEINVLFIGKEGVIDKNKTNAIPFDQFHFQLPIAMNKEAQGGLVCGKKGIMKGVILENQGGKGTCLSCKAISDVLQKLAREGKSREKKVSKELCNYFNIQFEEEEQEQEEVEVEVEPPKGVVTVRVEEREEINEGFDDLQMVSNKKKNTQEAEDGKEENPQLEFNLDLQVPQHEELIYSEVGFYINPLSNQLVGYHPKECSVTHHEVTIGLKKDYSLTQTSIGLIIVSSNKAWLWDTYAFSPISDLKVSHKHHTACIHNGSLVVISGKDTVEVEALNLRSLSWRSLEPLEKPREYAASFSVGNDLYVVGGIKSGKTCRSVIRLNRRWEKLTFKLPQRLSSLGAIGFEDSFIIFGGLNEEGEENPNAWKIIYEGSIKELGQTPVKGTFWGHQPGKFDNEYTYCTRNARILSYDSRRKKFYLVSIGNNDESFIIS